MDNERSGHTLLFTVTGEVIVKEGDNASTEPRKALYSFLKNDTQSAVLNF